jgi:hypothetical protein
MKGQKLKNYNQLLLALLGTIGVLLLISLLFSNVANQIQRYSYEVRETGILSGDKVKDLQSQNKRQQVISYESPKLIDTLNSVYIIPVSHKFLNKPEEISSEYEALMSMENDFDSETDKRYSRAYFGDFNNVIIYNQKTEKTEKLFSKRVNFDEIKTEYFPDDVLLILKIADRDTNKDGVINLIDYTSLFIYSLNEKRLKKIEFDGMDVFNYEFVNMTKDLIIRFGIDKDNNGGYDSDKEPTILKKYDFKTEKVTDIVNDSISFELQQILEGTKNQPISY